MARWKTHVELLLNVIELLFRSLAVEALQGKMRQNLLPSGGGWSLIGANDVCLGCMVRVTDRVSVMVNDRVSSGELNVLLICLSRHLAVCTAPCTRPAVQ